MMNAAMREPTPQPENYLKKESKSNGFYYLLTKTSMIWFVLPLPATATALVGLLQTSGFILAAFVAVYGGAFFSVPILRLRHSRSHPRKGSIGLVAIFASKTYLVLVGGVSVLSLFLALFRTHDRIRQIQSFLENSVDYFSRLSIAELTYKLCESRGGPDAWHS